MKCKCKSYDLYGYKLLITVYIDAKNYTRKKIYYRAITKNGIELSESVNITLGRVIKIKDEKLVKEHNKSILKNVLIIAESGVLITNYATKHDALIGQDQSLISGLISAIKSFANCIRREEIEFIEMTSSSITVLPSSVNSLVFIIITGNKESRIKNQIILEEIRDEVIEKYRSHLIGDSISVVSDAFHEKLNAIIINKCQKYRYI